MVYIRCKNFTGRRLEGGAGKWQRGSRERQAHLEKCLQAMPPLKPESKVEVSWTGDLVMDWAWPSTDPEHRLTPDLTV